MWPIYKSISSVRCQWYGVYLYELARLLLDCCWSPFAWRAHIVYRRDFLLKLDNIARAWRFESHSRANARAELWNRIRARVSFVLCRRSTKHKLRLRFTTSFVGDSSGLTHIKKNTMLPVGLGRDSFFLYFKDMVFVFSSFQWYGWTELDIHFIYPKLVVLLVQEIASVCCICVVQYVYAFVRTFKSIFHTCLL